MKTKHFLFASIVSVVAILACNKLKNTPPHSDSFNEPKVEEKTNLRHITQKSYNLSEQECINLIKRFKTKNNNQSNLAQRLIDIDSVRLDSGTFVLEAALNYDFDYYSEENLELMTQNRSISVPYNDDTEKINSNDLENIYASLSASIDSLINDSIKIYAIDVEGYVYDPGTSTAIFDLNIIEQKTSIVNPCSYTSISSSASLQYIQWLGCANGITQNAPTLLSNMLNCALRGKWCAFNRSFYSNISTVFKNTTVYGITYPNPAPNILFSSEGGKSSAQHCSSAYSSLSPTQLGTYYTNLTNYALSFKPTNPSNLIVVANIIKDNRSILTNGSGYYTIYWTMSATYAVRNCIEEPDK